MKSIVRFLIVFFVLSLIAMVATQYFGFAFGDKNYWDQRGVFFLFFVTLFPRLTLLFSSVASGGLFWWLGWLFAPRILVAILATLSYWHQNPILVCLAWVIAIGGESTEKNVVFKRSRVVRFGGMKDVGGTASGGAGRGARSDAEGVEVIDITAERRE